MTSRSSEDRELIRRYLAGDADAFDALMTAHQDRVFSICLRMLRDRDSALDATQDVFLTVFRKVDRYREQAAFSTWLYRVAVNEALQFLRRASRTRVKLREVVPANGVPSGAERSTVRLDVNAALADLAPNERIILLLRYQEGLDYRAIAEVVGCAAGTVASRLNRARDALREILRKSYAPREESRHEQHPTVDGKVSSKTSPDRRWKSRNAGRVGS